MISSSFSFPLQVDNLTVNMRTYLVGYCRDGMRHVSNATGRRGESTSCGLWHTWQLCIITEQNEVLITTSKGETRRNEVHPSVGESSPCHFKTQHEIQPEEY